MLEPELGKSVFDTSPSPIPSPAVSSPNPRHEKFSSPNPLYEKIEALVRVCFMHELFEFLRSQSSVPA